MFNRKHGHLEPMDVNKKQTSGWGEGEVVKNHVINGRPLRIIVTTISFNTFSKTKFFIMFFV